MEDKKAQTGNLETAVTGRRDVLKASVAAAAAGVVAASGLPAESEAQEAAKAGACEISDAQRRAVYGRATKFCIVPHDSLAMTNNRTNEEVTKAQKLVTDDLLNSLETFVRAARAGRLEGAAVLGLACAEW